MIQLKKRESGNLTLYSFGFPNGPIFEFLPGYGAGLNAIHIQSEHGFTNIIEGYSNLEDIEKNEKIRYLGSFLFPFPNRLKTGKYHFEGRNLQLPINEVVKNNALHGFLYNKPFVVSGIFTDGEIGKLEMVYRQEYPPDYYPFPFEVRIKWEFSKTEIKCHTSVENIGEGNMPLGFGWHPYFKTGQPVNSWKILLPTGNELIVDDQMIPTGEKKMFKQFEKPTDFGAAHFDTGFDVSNNLEKATSSFIDEAISLQVNVWQETGEGKYNYLQVYSPSDRMMLAIEPMTCPANAFQSEESLIKLGPGKIQKASFGITWLNLNRK